MIVRKEYIMSFAIASGAGALGRLLAGTALEFRTLVQLLMAPTFVFLNDFNFGAHYGVYGVLMPHEVHGSILLTMLLLQGVVGGLLLIPFVCAISKVWRCNDLNTVREWAKKNVAKCSLKGFRIGASIAFIGALTIAIQGHYPTLSITIAGYILMLPGRIFAQAIGVQPGFRIWPLIVAILLQGILGALIYSAVAYCKQNDTSDMADA